MHTPNFGVYQLRTIPSVCENLFHECASIRSRYTVFPCNQLTNALHLKDIGVGRRSLSVECTPPTLASTNSSLSPLAAKLCSISVHRSIHDLEFYLLISRLMLHLRHSGRAVDLCPSNALRQLWCLLPCLHPLCLLNECATIRSRFRTLPHIQQANAHYFTLEA